MRLFLLSCLVAALTPLLPLDDAGGRGSGAGAARADAFPGWPAHPAGRDWRELPLGEREAGFAKDFPGRVARFHDGEREWVLRWVTTPTRRLHPAADCFRGAGYAITPLSIVTDEKGRRWARFRAEREGERMLVRERIEPAANPAAEGWTDASSWFWSAALGRAGDGPWLAWTSAERER